ncbi:alanine/glycine:cation symporter family protein [Lacipirellula sp.]|uniref:alanine/glycine:cation symporter family protein n=1 Tax=Lacipirellula sp. TaxID=2691419 RepID=UPI003D0AA50D
MPESASWMDSLAESVDKISATMYWPWAICLLFSVAIFFTFRSGFVQVRRFGEALSTMVASQQAGAGGALSPFQAFMMGLGSTIGVGNIAGVAAAIITGGPGALFWIWCYGFFGMAVKFGEAALGLKYRIAKGEQTLAGPMYYLRDGLGSPALAWIYAFVAGIACLLTTPFTQPNSIAIVIDSQFKKAGMDLGTFNVAGADLRTMRLVVGVILAVLAWAVCIGGVKSIGRVLEKLSPFKVGFYLLGGLAVIAMNIGNLPAVLHDVFTEAFSLRPIAGATVGGFMGTVMGQALRLGLARGAYANEAGYGTAAVVYGVAKSDRPEQQGLNAVMEVFIITFITSTISALTILLTGVWKLDGMESSAAVAEAFNTTIPTAGGWMVAFSVLLFGYTALVGWSFYGEQFLEYLFGRRIVMPYRWLYCLLVPVGAVAKVDLVWSWGDILNGAQVFPNLIGIVGLSGIVAKFAFARKVDNTTKS